MMTGIKHHTPQCMLDHVTSSLLLNRVTKSTVRNRTQYVTRSKNIGINERKMPISVNNKDINWNYLGENAAQGGRHVLWLNVYIWCCVHGLVYRRPYHIIQQITKKTLNKLQSFFVCSFIISIV